MSLCDPPSLSFPSPPANVIDAIVEFLEALGIPIPAMPSLPLPDPPCPLDDL